MFNKMFEAATIEMVNAMKESMNPSSKSVEQELAELRAKLEVYDRALDVEVWNSKLGKFMKFRDMPDVAKVLKNEKSE